MDNKRTIPYGVINWATLVRECHFVDNTAYIRELENVRTPVFLRPKRFGKSIVCSMLAHYYDVALRDRFEELFGKTDIGRAPTPLRNSFLVLPLDFSTVQVGTLAEIERNFWSNVKGAVGSFCVKYKAIADWSRVEATTGPADCIDKVRDVIRENNLPPLYVIIDEYDTFTNELVVSNRDLEYNAICGHDARGDATRESFFKTFFKAFKAGLTDGTVGRTYFTGVLPMFYSFETEYNSPEGRCDFLAIPKPGFGKPAKLIEFKYFTNGAAKRGKILGRAEPDAETVRQSLAYRAALSRRPDWRHPVSVTVVEVCGSVGYNWFDLPE